MPPQQKVFHLPAIGTGITDATTVHGRTSTSSAPKLTSNAGKSTVFPRSKTVDSTRPLNRTRKGKGRGSNDTADAQLWGAVALMSHMSKSFSTRGVGPTLAQRTLANAGTIDSTSPAPGGSNGFRSTLGHHNNRQTLSTSSTLALRYDPRRPTGFNTETNFPGSNAHLNVDAPKPKLSLAQKMGLVEAPPPPPQEEVWEIAQKKAVHRGDSLQPCAICHEKFASDVHDPRAQVILDCSHVFHLTCLEQFEKFQRKAQGVHWTRQCPVCRHSHYHKRIHHAGKAQIQIHAVTKIQSLVRGMISRKRYLQLKLQTNPQFKSDYYFRKLSDMSEAYFNYAVAREKEVDRFLDEVDLQRQRAVAEMMTPQDWQLLRDKALTQLRVHRRSISGVSRIQVDGTVTTDEPRENIEEEGETGCPICMNSVLTHDSTTSQGAVEQSPALLSCGHCFHAKCLETFEKFTVKNRTGDINDSGTIPRCPLCRAGYVKSDLFV